jgi:hypothetical protein
MPPRLGDGLIAARRVDLTRERLEPFVTSHRAITNQPSQ